MAPAGSGDGTTTDRYLPVQVIGLSGVTEIAAGGHHSLALKSDGTVWAWGNNLSGQLGIGSTTDSPVPVQISEFSGVTAIIGGGFHSLALKSDGSVWAWGYNNYGELGDGTSTNRYTPVQVPGLTGIQSIAAGGHHSLAVKNDGTVWAWGNNGNGRLGDGTTIDRNSPVQVNGLTNVISIAAGGCHSLALKSDGTVWSWGYNNYGQLGDGTNTDRSSPVEVNGLIGATSIGSTSFGYHSLAIVPIVKVITGDADNITATGARLNGTLNNMVANSIANVSFQWGTEPGVYPYETQVQQMDSTGDYSFTLDNLSAKTTYYFRAKAVGDGTNYGSYSTFTTLPVPPAVTTNDANPITPYDATLNGSLTDMGSASQVYVSFEWGPTQDYGQITSPQELSSAVNFSANLATLRPNATYHFRAKAQGDGTVYGDDFTLHTPAVPPSIDTQNAGIITANSAVLNGYLSDLGSAEIVNVSFQWGLTDAYGNTTTSQNVTGTGSFSTNLTSLLPKTAYHFRAVAQGDGTTYGNDFTFNPLPVEPHPPPGRRIILLTTQQCCMAIFLIRVQLITSW